VTALLDLPSQAAVSPLVCSVVCAWCQRWISGPLPNGSPVSHGICDACAEDLVSIARDDGPGAAGAQLQGRDRDLASRHSQP
jgi:hypothetical protein